MKTLFGFVVLSLLMFTCGFVGAESINREARQELERDLANAEGKALASSTNLTSCISMYSDAATTQDHCERALKRCLQVPEFGR